MAWDKPKIQTAVVAGADGNLTISTTAAIPAVGKDTVLVRTAAVALNPVDAKLTRERATPGATSGFDFAGIAVAVGEEVSHIQAGDRVCGAVTGQNPLDLSEGAFAQYVAAEAHAIL